MENDKRAGGQADNTGAQCAGCSGQCAGNTDNAGTEKQGLIKDCPFRKMGIPNNCDEIPANIICGNGNCWNIGLKMDAVKWESMTENDIQTLSKDLMLKDAEVIDGLIDKYIEKHKQTV